jgi:membrane-bound lytic murein transglycosylase B
VPRCLVLSLHSGRDAAPNAASAQTADRTDTRAITESAAGNAADKPAAAAITEITSGARGRARQLITRTAASAGDAFGFQCRGGVGGGIGLYSVNLDDDMADRPRSGWVTGCVAAVVLACAVSSTAQVPQGMPPAPRPAFQIWLRELVEEAWRRGFDRDLVAQALSRLQPLPRVIQADRAQAAAAPPLDAYLSARLTPPLVARGREMLRDHRDLLARIERWFGVQRRFVVAIWGAETGYGPYTGDVPVFQALATLAWEPRRADYFRAELFDALRMVQRRHIDIPSMVGSWAGAMGQPQFMPSSYLKHAFDFDRDGRRDIWDSIPDTLASIANYLRGYDWHNGETWGREVRLTAAVRDRIMRDVEPRREGCSAVRSLTGKRTLDDWAAFGVRSADGSPLPRAHLDASLVLAADERMFLVYHNYEAILGYNCSHPYALSVAMLADLLR